MMDHFYPFPSVSGDRRIGAKDVAALLATFFTTGVSPVPASSLQVAAGQAMTVRLQPGACCINGYVGRNDEAKQLTLEVASGVLPRVDRVVLRLDLTGRMIESAVKTGQPAASPVAPALRRDALVHELAVADVLVGKGVSEILPSVISDRRHEPELCGWMGLVKGTDTSALFAQWGAEFHEWLTGIQSLLTENIASNIAQTLWEHDQRLDAIEGGGVVSVYTHQRQGTQHRLTGSGSNGRALIAAAYQSGDTFAVNGVACAAYWGGEAVTRLPVGHWVSFVWDGVRLDFTGGMPGTRIVVSATQPAADPDVLWVKV